jgi:transcriptional regulator with PAS, ATPase and Fis domain
MRVGGTDFQHGPPPVPLCLLLPSGEQILIEGRLTIGAADENSIALHDSCVSRNHCQLEVVDGRTLLRDLGSTNGTWVNGVRVTEAELRAGARIALGVTRLRVIAADAQSPILGESEPVKRLRNAIRMVAPVDATVLILGETGAGKDLVAQSLHQQSKRPGAYVAMNCATLTPALVESILFGHERGAFTGAAARQSGLFEQANNGTLFLDELAELELGLQSRLLRVLEHGIVRPVGASEEVPVNVRVVAATNVDLGGAVAAGRFREDLYYRLNQQVLHVPSLRERRGDVLMLAEHFLSEIDRGAHFTDAATRRLLDYEWPGNVRELRHCIARAAMLGQSVIDAPDIVFTPLPKKAARMATTVQVQGRTLEEIQRDVFKLAIAENNGNVLRAAAALGVPKSTFYDRVRRLGLA